MQSSTRSLSLLTLCLAAVLSILTLTPAAAAPIPQFGTVTGNVYGDNNPIAATITVRASTGQFLFTTTASADGRFKLELAPGDYTLTASATGYTSDTEPVTVTSNAIVGVRFFLYSRGGPL